MTDTFDDEFLAEGEKSPVLGPHYFDARAVAERIVTKFEDEDFKGMIEKFADQFRDELWNSVQSSLLSDVECNVQGEIWRMVDNVVRAILGGNKWALDRYVLGDRYDCAEVRAAVAALIPAELQNPRISDLEVEIDRLRKENTSLRDRRY